MAEVPLKADTILQSEETWKDIPGYEGLYQASTLGKISNSRGRTLKENLIKKGYYHITLYKSGIPKTFKLHRLIAFTHIYNPNNFAQINHINGVKTDNYIENLEWCDHSHNQLHAYKTGLNKARRGVASHRFGKTRGLSNRAKLVLDTQTGIFYDCAKDAADAKGFSYMQIKYRLQGKGPTNSGLIYV